MRLKFPIHGDAVVIRNHVQHECYPELHRPALTHLSQEVDVNV